MKAVIPPKRTSSKSKKKAMKAGVKPSKGLRAPWMTPKPFGSGSRGKMKEMVGGKGGAVGFINTGQAKQVEA